VIRFGRAYPDAVVDRIATEIDDAGLAARIADLDPGDGSLDTTARIALDCTATDPQDGEALAAAVATLLDAARRRRRRQDATGEPRDVTVTLHLPGEVRIDVPDPDPEQAPLLVAAASDGRLAAGTWRWDGAGRCLEPAR